MECGVSRRIVVSIIYCWFTILCSAAVSAGVRACLQFVVATSSQLLLVCPFWMQIVCSVIILKTLCHGQ